MTPLSPQRTLLRLVPRQPQPRRLEVRIAVADGRSLIGRSRAFRITEDNLRQLIDHAFRMEARSP
ncbi:MAG: hypothetical protein CR217_15990 [Beijerinckiaceae bacterium]|nr:MAG: hypothetical protein CR217_15990 [Beijerinckiaceae bacterium]